MSDKCCKDCQKRYLGCHADCKEYKEYCDRLKEIRQKRYKEQEAIYVLYDGVVRTKKKSNPRFRRNKK